MVNIAIQCLTKLREGDGRREIGAWHFIKVQVLDWDSVLHGIEGYSCVSCLFSALTLAFYSDTGSKTCVVTGIYLMFMILEHLEHRGGQKCSHEVWDRQCFCFSGIFFIFSRLADK